MSEQLVLLHPGADYGALALKKSYQTFLSRGFLVAAALHLAGVGSYWGVKYLGRDEEPRAMVRIMKYSELGPPPSITNSASAPAIAISAPTVKPSVGIPVPVPDAEVDPTQTIATQQELSQAVAPINEGTAGGTDIKIQDDGPPPDFVPFEKEPAVIKRVEPKYPDIATRAGVEGTVWVKLWVDKEGKVHKVVIMKSDAEVLNQAAIDAAQQFLFTPAMQHSGPVAVWVSFPFRFRLSGHQ